MGNFYPNRLIKSKVPNGEYRVFKKLQNELEDNNVHVLHSVQFKDTKKQRDSNATKKTRLEGDFLIVHPFYGACIIEVKGGSISYDPSSGVWKHTNRTNVPYTRKESPFDQADQVKFALEDYFKNKIKFLKVISIVIFTDIEKKSLPESSEIPLKFVFDKNDMRSNNLIKFIEKVFRNEGAKQLEKALDPAFISGSIRSHFAIDFAIDFKKEYMDGIRRLDNLSSELKEQAEIYYNKNSMNSFITGAAGTGKTLLAKIIMLEKIRNKEKVLYLCKNKNLAQIINLEISNKIDDDKKYFQSLNVDSTKKLKDESYDLIVFDEAQDIIRSEYIDKFIGLLNPTKLKNGFLFVGDFENQDIYSRAYLNKAENILNNSGIFFNQHRLSVNLRNNRPLGEYIADLINTPVLWQNFQLDVEMSFPSKETAKSDLDFNLTGNWYEKLNLAIKFMREEGKISSTNITVLCSSNESINNLLYCQIEGIKFKRVSDNIDSFLNKNNDDNVVFCETIHQFKGLESQFVIVLMDYINKRKDEDPGEYFRKLIYVAASRANFGTSILTSKRLGDAI